LRDFIRDERLRRRGHHDDLLAGMYVLVEPVLSPEGDHIVGWRQLDTGASAVIVGRGCDRIWQRDDETIEAFGVRILEQSRPLLLAARTPQI
jgi:hypothetical protein